MKTNKLYPIFLFFISICAFSQPQMKVKREQIKSLKVAYITDQLELTADEAARFWPLYNAYEDKQTALRQEKIRGYLDKIDEGEVDKMNDKDALSLLNQMETTEDELFQLRKKFILNLKTVLSTKKIIKLKKAEEGFNRRLLRQYREKMLKD